MSTRSRSASILEYIYEKTEKIGEGAFGEVWKGRNKQTGEVVAIKRIKMEHESEGFPITAMREIKILKKLNGIENVVRLLDVCYSSDKSNKSFYMVFEYLDHDLTGLIYNPSVPAFSESQVKCYMKQLFEGLYRIHLHNVLHRDLKSSNLLIDNKGTLKIADFGLAREVDIQKNNLTNRVVTIWYRAPELLLGERAYGPQVDMWSAGCVLAEMLLRAPLFKGKDELDQLSQTCELCGTPEKWPNSTIQPPPNKPRKLRQFLASKGISDLAIDLIDRLLEMDPAKRITASDALEHDWFSSGAPIADKASLPKYPSSNDFQIRNLHEKKRKLEEAMAQQQQQQQQYQQHQHHYNQAPPNYYQHRQPRQYPSANRGGRQYQQQQQQQQPPPPYHQQQHGAMGYQQQQHQQYQPYQQPMRYSTGGGGGGGGYHNQQYPYHQQQQHQQYHQAQPVDGIKRIRTQGGFSHQQQQQLLQQPYHHHQQQQQQQQQRQSYHQYQQQQQQQLQPQPQQQQQHPYPHPQLQHTIPPQQQQQQRQLPPTKQPVFHPMKQPRATMPNKQQQHNSIVDVGNGGAVGGMRSTSTTTSTNLGNNNSGSLVPSSNGSHHSSNSSDDGGHNNNNNPHHQHQHQHQHQQQQPAAAI